MGFFLAGILYLACSFGRWVFRAEVLRMIRILILFGMLVECFRGFFSCNHSLVIFDWYLSRNLWILRRFSHRWAQQHSPNNYTLKDSPTTIRDGWVIPYYKLVSITNIYEGSLCIVIIVSKLVSIVVWLACFFWFGVFYFVSIFMEIWIFWFKSLF